MRHAGEIPKAIVQQPVAQFQLRPAAAKMGSQPVDDLRTTSLIVPSMLID
jgi:hypothetical protein